MTADPFSAPSLGELFAPAAMRRLLADERRVRAMVRTEIALARANARCGIIPEEAARAIEKALADCRPDLGGLGCGTEAAGVPIPELVVQLRAQVGGTAGEYVHWGATSQDVIDTALVLVLGEALDRLELQLGELIDALGRLAHRHRDTVMLARTRMQQAAPTTFGLKVAGWREPLCRSRARLDELRPRLLVVQLGGAAGTLAPWGADGPAVRAALAEELGLGVPALPWHTQRDGIVELAGWLGLVTGALGTIGVDVGLLAQSEVGEVAETAEAERGGSSTLPQKNNPVSSEMLVALARYNANAVAAMHQALLHEGERSGAAWALEWLTLPGMVLTASGALRHAHRVVGGLVVDAARMHRNLEANGELCLASSAVFALARSMPRSQAQSLVRCACREAQATGERLTTVLARRTEGSLPWDGFADPARHTGAAGTLVDAALGGPDDPVPMASQPEARAHGPSGNGAAEPG